MGVKINSPYSKGVWKFWAYACQVDKVFSF